MYGDEGRPRDSRGGVYNDPIIAEIPAGGGMLLVRYSVEGIRPIATVHRDGYATIVSTVPLPFEDDAAWMIVNPDGVSLVCGSRLVFVPRGKIVNIWLGFDFHPYVAGRRDIVPSEEAARQIASRERKYELDQLLRRRLGIDSEY